MVENRISGALCGPGKIPGLLLLFSGINSDMEDKRERKEIRGLSIKQEIKKKILFGFVFVFRHGN